MHISTVNSHDRDLGAQLLLPAGRDDPYAIYRDLRDAAPAVFSPALRCWLVGRHADVVAGFGDRRLSSRKFAGYLRGVPLSADDEAAARRIRPFFSLFMLQMDAPDHTRQRALVQHKFTPRVVDDMRPTIEGAVAALLARLAPRGAADLIPEVAVPLPATVIMDLLGVPEAGRTTLYASTAALAEFLGIVRPPPGRLVSLAARLDAADLMLRDLIARRRRTPTFDLLGQLAQAELRGDGLSETELVVASVFLLGAGHETTAHHIGNAMQALLAAPDLLASLQRAPEGLPEFLDEIARLESPLQFAGRLASEELDIGGVTIPAGSFVRLGLGAANRDPLQFTAPDELRPGRPRGRSLAFGRGIHHCLGAALARMEAEIVVGAVIQRLPGLRHAGGQPAWIDNYVMRGLQRLQAAWDVR